jgi:hypothetical protein
MKVPEKTIQLNRLNADGQEETVDVIMRYCVATEIGFSAMTDHEKTVDVFNPTFETIDGKTQIKEPAKATEYDYCRLIMSAIIAAYEARSTDEHTVKEPVTMKDLLHRSTRQQFIAALQAVIDLRVQWLTVPDAIKPETQEEGERNRRKNVKQPTTSTR